MLGRPLFEVCPDLVPRGLDAHYHAALTGEARVLAHRFHRYLIAGTGGSSRSRARGSRRSKRTGTILGTITVIEDVSERVASERELRNQIETSESARAVAEEAVRVKDEFLATLSHEIRTPLNAVLGWTKILLGRQVDPAMLTRALTVIDRNAVAQTRLIDDMLDMARIMSGKLRLELQPVDLAAIALSALDVVAPAAAARGVELRKNLDVSRPVDDGGRRPRPADHLEPALERGEVHRSRRTRDRRHRSTRRTCSRSTWKTPGAASRPDFLPQMFERFRQADSSSSRRHGGLGLGLSLVRQLVELHGGRVTATSEVGAGSRFTVSFPGRTEVTQRRCARSAAGRRPARSRRACASCSSRTRPTRARSSRPRCAPTGSR